MVRNIKDIKPQEPKHSNESNREVITLSSLPDQRNKDQPIVEATTASSKDTQTPLYDEGT